MRIGFIVDGQGEPAYFQALIPKLQTASEILERPLYADMQPRATPTQIAKAASGAVKVFASKVDLIVVLIDTEGATCPGAFAKNIEGAFQAIYGRNPAFSVVGKHHAIENWLLADLDALKAMRGRFKLTQALERRVLANVDGCSDAARMLNSIALKRDYHKRHDPPAIGAYQCPERIAIHSRSFRKLLRTVNHHLYQTQSKQAVLA